MNSESFLSFSLYRMRNEEEKNREENTDVHCQGQLLFFPKILMMEMKEVILLINFFSST